MHHYNYIIFLFFIFTNNYGCDLIIFSYNRPMQLQAYLESLLFYVKNVSSVSIIYRADIEYNNAYEKLAKKFYKFNFIKQDCIAALLDFKKLVLDALSRCKSGYIMFAVDDIIVTDNIDLLMCTQALSKYNAYGFYLRLGRNIDYCYMQNKYSGIPRFKLMKNAIIAWKFSDGSGDWSFPNTVDMTIYDIRIVFNNLSRLSFYNPSTLEGQWAMHSSVNKMGLCFNHSKIINIPINIVQTIWKQNRNMNLYSIKNLLDRFYNGEKINWKKYHKINNRSPHIEVDLNFVAQ